MNECKNINSNIIPVFMAGGYGKRLWPISDASYPKQFIKQHNHLSFFQKTLLRNKILGEGIIVINKAHYAIVVEQLNEINYKPKYLLIEEIGKNTYLSLITISILLQKLDIDNFIIFPTDHHIEQMNHYLSSINDMKNYLMSGDCELLCIFGIKPKYISTQYGYIKINDLKTKNLNHKLTNVNLFFTDKFIEKPNQELAEEYFKSNQFLWNSGIYGFNNKQLLKFIKKNDSIYTNVTNINSKIINNLRIYFDMLDFENQHNNEIKNEIKNEINIPYIKTYNEIDDISIDYAITEKLDNIAVFKTDFKWIDIGSWRHLWQFSNKAATSNNVIDGKKIIAHNVSTSYINNMSDKQIIAADVKDLVVISKDNKIIITNINSNANLYNLLHKDNY